MMSKNRFWIVLLAVACIASTASAAIVFEEDFDSYAVGSNMNGQGGWEDWAGPGGAGGIVSWVGTIDSDNILDISGGSDLVYDGWDYASEVITFNIKQYIPSTATGTTYCILLSKHLATPEWAMQLSFNLDAGTVTADMDNSLGRFNVLTDQWARIKAEIDLTDNTVDVYYEGTLIRSGQWSGGAVELTTLDLYANGADTVYYDDVSIVPEPATLLLLSLGGLMIRKRK